MALVERRPDHMTRDQDHLPQTVADVSKEMHAATAFVRHHGCFSPHGLPALKYSGSNVSAALAMIVDGAAGSFDVCGMRQMTTDFRQVAVTHSQHLLVAGEAQPLPPRLTAAFYVTGTLNLTQLRFSNQDISAAGGDNTGGGIYLGGGGALSAAGVVFANLSASHGGAVFVGDGSAGAVFTECTFVGNKATAVWGGGGAVAVFPGAAAVFMRCRFAQNKAHLGGAIWSNGAVHVELCAFDGNAATARGGGLVAADGSAAALNISSSSFVRTLRYLAGSCLFVSLFVIQNFLAAKTRFSHPLLTPPLSQANNSAKFGPAVFVYSDLERWDPSQHRWFPGTCDAPGVGCDGSDWVDPRAGFAQTKNCCYADTPILTLHRGNPGR